MERKHSHQRPLTTKDKIGRIVLPFLLLSTSVLGIAGCGEGVNNKTQEKCPNGIIPSSGFCRPSQQ